MQEEEEFNKLCYMCKKDKKIGGSSSASYGRFEASLCLSCSQPGNTSFILDIPFMCSKSQRHETITKLLADRAWASFIF